MTTGMKYEHEMGPVVWAPECVGGYEVSQILGHLNIGKNDQLWVPGHWLVIKLATL